MMLTKTSRIDKVLKQPTTYFQSFRDDFPYDWVKAPRHKYEYEMHYILFPINSEPIELNVSRSLCMSFLFGNLEEANKESFLSEFNESLDELTYYVQNEDYYFPIVNIDDLNGILECKRQENEDYKIRLIDEEHSKIYELGFMTKEVIWELTDYLDTVVEGFMEYASNDFDNFPRYEQLLMQKYHFDEKTKAVFQGLNYEYQILERELSTIEELDEGINKGFITEAQAKEEYEAFMEQWNIDTIIEGIAKEAGKTKEELLELSETVSAVQGRLEKLLDSEITSEFSLSPEENMLDGKA